MPPSSQLHAQLMAAAADYEAGRLAEAAEACAALERSHPASGDVAHLSGLVAWATGDRDRAIALLRRAVKAGVQQASLHANLAIFLVATGDVSGGAQHATAALRLDPRWPQAHAAMADALFAAGAVQESIAALRAGLAIAPSPEMHANVLYEMSFVGSYPRAEVFEEHRAWARAHAAAVPRGPAHANDRDPERRLRVGYLSADLHGHSVAHFLRPLMAAHDRGAVEVHAFASVKRPDAMTERLRAAADAWVPVADCSDAEVAAMVREAKIDVLVELGGHTADSRLLVLARRPAPVQVSWLGYPNTTGLDAVGYRLTDAWVDPEGEADRWHVEELVRLPAGFLCYEAPANAPDVAPAPSAASGRITFGSFNTLAKMTPRVVETWARVLRKVDGSRLFLKAGPLADASVRQRVAQQFAQHGVDASRLQLEGRTPAQHQHLARYAEVDVALDPFPYNGTTTTCEALWMGVPVVALEGDRHVARVSASLLRRAGLERLVAASQKDYVTIAAELARDRARLADLRGSLRGRFAASPLGDAAGFARQVEAAYRGMWRAWCASGAA